MDGKTYRLSDYKGKKEVYLKFWASWCSICLSTLEDTNDLAKAEEVSYVVLSVVAPTFNGEKSEADFKTGTSLWITRISRSYWIVKGELLKKDRIRSYPSALFINSDGTFAKVILAI